MTPVTPELHSVVKKYLGRGILKGGELLLKPEDALEMADDLEIIQVPLLGVTGWHYVDRNKGWIVEDLAVDYYVGDSIWLGNNPVEESIKAVKEYLTESLPPSAEFVTLDIDMPKINDLLNE